jgi:hypothetical protein
VPAQYLHVLIGTVARKLLRQKLKRRHGQVNLIGVMLVHLGETSMRRSPYLAFARFEFAHDELYQGRFPVSYN